MFFLGLFKRYLGDDTARDKNRVAYKNYANEVRLLAYCLMPNHFHLLLYDISGAGMVRLLKSLAVAYGMYFNKKYKRTGALFQQRYRAVRMTDDAQFMHISRYIHMNPKDYRHWKWSSLGYYLNHKQSDWLHTGMLPNVGDYGDFLAEYESRRDELAEMKDQLAG